MKVTTSKPNAKSFWRPMPFALLPIGFLILVLAIHYFHSGTFAQFYVGLIGVVFMFASIFYGLDTVSISGSKLASRVVFFIPSGSVDLDHVTSCRFYYIGGYRGRELRLTIQDKYGHEARVFPRGWSHQTELITILRKALVKSNIDMDPRTARLVDIR